MSAASEVPAIPEDVREAAARAASMIKRYPLTEAGIAGLIEGIAMKARATRPVDTGREKALEGWQDISTAPKDGTYILLGWFEEDDFEVCGGEWNMHPKPGEDGLNGFNGWLQKAPTHWMPVTPPALASQKKGDGRG